MTGAVSSWVTVETSIRLSGEVSVIGRSRTTVNPVVVGVPSFCAVMVRPGTAQ